MISVIPAYLRVDKSTTSNQSILAPLAILLIAFEEDKKYVASQTSTIEALFTAHSFTFSDLVVYVTVHAVSVISPIQVTLIVFLVK